MAQEVPRESNYHKSGYKGQDIKWVAIRIETQASVNFKIQALDNVNQGRVRRAIILDNINFKRM